MATFLPDRIDVATFGEFLRDARERRGLTLQQIARETRIPWRHLDALEHGNLDAVPSGMYRRAEIRAYADAVGLDRGLALAQLEAALESSVAQRVTTPAESTTDGRPRLMWTALSAVGIVAATTLAVWLRHETPAPPVMGGASRLTDARSTPPATPAGAPRPTPAPVPAAGEVLTVAASTPATTAPPTVASPDVALTVTSDPPGARVMVDGIGRGATPVTIHNLISGARRIRIIKDGYLSQERVVRVGDTGRPATVHVTMEAVH